MKGLVTICALFAVLLPFGISVPALAQTAQSSTQGSQPIPEYVIYEYYFGKMAFLEGLAQQKEKDGVNGNSLRAAIARELGISEAQRIVFAKIGAQALAQASALDAQAKGIIENNRSNYTAALLAGTHRAPKMPPDLTQLQASRNNVFLNAKAQLLDQLDSVTFQNIDSRIKAISLPKLHVKSAR